MTKTQAIKRIQAAVDRLTDQVACLANDCGLENHECPFAELDRIEDALKVLRARKAKP